MGVLESLGLILGMPGLVTPRRQLSTVAMLDGRHRLAVV
jgi:hypothetical protein